MSAVASIVILFVLAARLILKRAPKIFSYALWAIVLIRLLVPVHIPSPISAIPVTQTTNSAEINAVLPPLDFETPGDRQENSLSLQQSIEKDTPYVHVSHSLEPTGYLAIVWLAGMGVMVLYSCLSYWKIKKKVRVSVLLRDNIFIADDIGSPCVIGFGLPNIYLPNGLSEKEQEYIILHEQHHIKRLDHIVKGLAFVALTIHWFNPLVWVAFVLACKDMEMSCDEAVIRKLGSDVRADYSASLLTLATGHRIIAGTPLAFGEGDTKGRIKNLAKWRQPVFMTVVIGIFVCLLAGVLLLTNPIEDNGINTGVTYYAGTVVDSAMSVVNEGDREGRSYITLACDDGEDRLFWMAKNYEKPDVDLIGQYVIVRGKIESGTGLLVATNISISEKEFSDSLEEAINRCILDHNYSPRYEGMLQVASFVQLSSGSEGLASPESDMKLIEKATVYGLAFHQVFRLEDDILVEEGGSHIPVVLTFSYDASNGFTLTEYWEPRDGSYYAKDLKAKFNGRPWPDTQKYLQQQMMDNYLQAIEYFEVGTDVLINTLLDSVQAKAQFTLLENLLESEDADVQILLHYSNETLQYCFSEFLNGNQTDARADVMAAICKKIISDWGEPLLLIDSDPSQTPQEWFDFYLEQALKHFEEMEEDELIEKYPATCVLLKLTGHMNILPNWGITLIAENATPNGATIILTQEGGYRANGLVYGRDYNLQKYENNQWVNVEPITELIWFTDARTVPLDSSISWNIDWSQTFGTLEPGLYRFCKSISDHRAPGNNDYATFYAEFIIE
jgi:beta-lactamase regulating signal transducer with metallopeptidase domain